MLRRVYDRAGRLHDPAVRLMLSLVDRVDEDVVRAGITEALASRMRTPPRRLLDLGCGTGQELLRLARRFPEAELVGVDLSEGMMRHCARNLRDAGVSAWLAYADAHALPFADASFDGVVQVGAVNGWGDKPRALAEVARVCRPGAPVVLVDEALDPARARSRRHRLAFRLLTWYDRDPRAPVEALPPELESVALGQLTAWYYLLVAQRAPEVTRSAAR